MRRLTILAAVFAALAGGFASSSSAAAKTCFGAETNPAYIAAFDTVKGQKADGHVRYAQPRFLMEWQTWATPPGADPGHHSEHLHFAACIPNGQTIGKAFRLDILVTAFNMVDYDVTAAGESAVSKSGSFAIWQANERQLAGLQMMLERARPGNGPQTFAFSRKVTAPESNGFKEIRGSIALEASGLDAVFLVWRHDPRWYMTFDFPGLPSSEPIGNQRAIRVRPQMQFARVSDGAIVTDYHHSGFAGFGEPCEFPNITDTESDTWTRGTIAKPWRSSRVVCLYNTDGGGQWFLEIDPNHHVHDPSAPDGEDHGVLVAEGLRFGSSGNPGLKAVKVPVSSFAHGSLHKLVFVSHDFPECASQDGSTWAKCPAGTRGSWTNVVVLPFRKR